MKISQVAKLTGLSSKTIRYYESIGLIQAPSRQENGYRDYGSSEVRALQFVQRARQLGFNLEECSELLQLYTDPHRASAKVKALTLERIHHLEQQIEHLQSMKASLEELVTQCGGNEDPDCPIIEELACPHTHQH
ncbi:Cu(I)-responsive transcriptional regulator [Balneatrix alpica]|uniref:Cu(I)-responsive transcriptional regulator n=1 Tax=Balneatrix alpica TaxID=75684 RepID=A0ABV5Z8E8_9GAMM|nr:Cu(I)-responsive transcriptional regulator [Balneatrix alpica]